MPGRTGLFAAIGICSLLATAAHAQQSAQAQYDKAVAHVDRFVDHFRRTFERDSMLYELDQAESALALSDRLARERGDMAGAARAAVKLGDVLRYRDRWDASIEEYERGASSAVAAGARDIETRARLGHARSLLYGKRAISAARQQADRALALAKQTRIDKDLFDAWDLVAQLQIAAGDTAAAADSLNRAFVHADTINDDKLLFYGYLDRADLYQTLANACDYQRSYASCLEAVEKARRDYQTARAKAQALGWTGLVQQMDGFLSRLGVREQLIQQERAMREEGYEDIVFSPHSLDDIIVEESFVVGANDALPALLGWIEGAGGLPPATDARGANVRGRLAEMAGKADEALDWYVLAADLLEKDRRLLHDEKTRANYVDDRVGFYYLAITHLLEKGRIDQAFDYLQRSRSRVMADLLKSKDMQFSTPAERETYGYMLELSSRIGQHQTCLFQATAEGSPARGCDPGQPLRVANDARGVKLVAANSKPGDDHDIKAALDKMQAEYEKLRGRLAKDTPRLARLVDSPVASLKTVQRTLAEDNSELVTFLPLESRLLVWHIRPRSARVVSVFLPRRELRDKITRLRKTLTDPKVAFDEVAAHELYLFLLAPIMQDVRSKRLVIVPHDDLHFLPFQVLKTTRGGQYLDEKFQISYAPSATIMVTMAKAAPLRPRAILAVADPSLQHAPAEVQMIGARFDGQVESASLAREADVKKWVKDKQLVHFAVHGRFDSGQPLLSHLQLAAGDGDDGKLTAAEMYGLPLDDARLAVLSACETGTVQTANANDVIGMQRGLLFAGADAIILSSWPIDDRATGAWMKAFYEAAESTTPAAAVQAANRSVREQEGFGHPFYWTPFMLTGR